MELESNKEYAIVRGSEQRKSKVSDGSLLPFAPESRQGQTPVANEERNHTHGFLPENFPLVGWFLVQALWVRDVFSTFQYFKKKVN